MFRMTDEAGGASKTSASNTESISARLLSKKELAGALGVSTRTIENWIAQRRIPYLRLSARLSRFNLPKVLTALGRFEIKEAGGHR